MRWSYLFIWTDILLPREVAFRKNQASLNRWSWTTSWTNRQLGKNLSDRAVCTPTNHPQSVRVHIMVKVKVWLGSPVIPATAKASSSFQIISAKGKRLQENKKTKSFLFRNEWEFQERLCANEGEDIMRDKLRKGSFESWRSPTCGLISYTVQPLAKQSKVSKAKSKAKQTNWNFFTRPPGGHKLQIPLTLGFWRKPSFEPSQRAFFKGSCLVLARSSKQPQT